MRITVPVETDITVDLNDTEQPPVAKVETKTIDIYEKFLEFMQELEYDGYRPQKIVMHREVYNLIRRSDEYNQLVRYSREDELDVEMFLGVEIEVKDLGCESITDFIIYTDRKVVHSEMLEKTFLEDVDDKRLLEDLEVEELIHETNERVEER